MSVCMYVHTYTYVCVCVWIQRAKKGLRCRTSPTCTLSQNGYGGILTLKKNCCFFSCGQRCRPARHMPPSPSSPHEPRTHTPHTDNQAMAIFRFDDKHL